MTTEHILSTTIYLLGINIGTKRKVIDSRTWTAPPNTPDRQRSKKQFVGLSCRGSGVLNPRPRTSIIHYVESSKAPVKSSSDVFLTNTRGFI